MKITISVGGRFHAFDMARQLQRRGFLQRLITSYPKSKVREWGIDSRQIRSLLSHELVSRGYRLLARKTGLHGDPQFTFNNRYDRLAARSVPADADIAVAWSGMALHTLRHAKKSGAITILERNSTHIQFQDEILQEEYSRFGMRAQLADPRMVERELEEYAFADYVCLPSSFAQRSFLAKGVDPKKVFTVPFGVALEQFEPAEADRGTFRIVHCGALSIRKGVHYLLQAFHELKLPGAELWLIGQPSAEIQPFLEKYASPGIKLRGTFPQAELRHEYARCSVFCMASIEEGFGMVISQAMACGLPAIVTENTAGHDLVRDGVDGYVIPIRDVEALKSRILALYENRELAREMGLSARRRIESGCTWDHYGERLVAEYSSIVGMARAPVEMSAMTHAV